MKFGLMEFGFLAGLTCGAGVIIGNTPFGLVLAIVGFSFYALFRAMIFKATGD